MRCTTTENLLPLYVEGDLAEDEMQTVRAHLSSCDSCRRTEEEFRASQSRLHAFRAPEFGEEFYKSIRGAVMSEIRSRPPKPVYFFQDVRAHLPARPAMAALAVSSLVVCALLFYGVRYRFSNSGSHLVAVENGLRELNPSQYDGSNGSSKTGVAIKRERERAERQSGSSYGSPARQNLATVSQKDMRSGTTVPVRTNETSAAVRKSATASGASDSAAPTQAVARIEIQTSDPNIRIIWLGR